MLCVYVISADHDLKYMYVFIYIFFPVSCTLKAVLTLFLEIIHSNYACLNKIRLFVAIKYNKNRKDVQIQALCFEVFLRPLVTKKPKKKYRFRQGELCFQLKGQGKFVKAFLYNISKLSKSQMFIVFIVYCNN